MLRPVLAAGCGLLCTLLFLPPVAAGPSSDDPVLRRLDPQLRRMVEFGPPAPGSHLVTLVFATADERLRAQEALPDDVVPVAWARGYLEVRAPIERFYELASIDGVLALDEPVRAEPAGGQVITEGFDTIFLTNWHAEGLTGAGVRVAVFDTGFAGYEDLLGTELPDNVETYFFDEDWQDSVHGTACAEIIHDIAPDAELVFYQTDTNARFLMVMEDIIARREPIVSHSAGFPSLYPADDSSDISESVNEAAADNTVWVNAGGNAARRTWGGTLTDIDNDGILELEGMEDIPINDAGGILAVQFRWEDLWRNATIDMDIVLYNDAGVECDRGDRPQEGAGNIPYESASCSGSPDGGTLNILGVGGRPAVGVRSWLFSQANIPSSYRNGVGSIGVPSDASGALSVGAHRWDSEDIAGYSSRGPTDDGRIKPDVAAPSNISTVSYGQTGYSGSSASAPHAAGLAALLRQAYPWLPPSEIRALMERWTLDLGEPGKDNDYGAGILMVDAPPDEIEEPTPSPEPVVDEPPVVDEEGAGCSGCQGSSGQFSAQILMVGLPLSLIFGRRRMSTAA